MSDQHAGQHADQPNGQPTDQPTGQPTSHKSAAADGVERLATTAHKGIHTAAEAAHPAIDRLASSAHRAVNSADHAANHATDKLAKAGSKASATGEQYYAAGARYMHDHPTLTIGLAMAAGYLLSRLLAAR